MKMLSEFKKIPMKIFNRNAMNRVLLKWSLWTHTKTSSGAQIEHWGCWLDFQTQGQALFWISGAWGGEQCRFAVKHLLWLHWIYLEVLHSHRGVLGKVMCLHHLRKTSKEKPVPVNIIPIHWCVYFVMCTTNPILLSGYLRYGKKFESVELYSLDKVHTSNRP